MEMQMTIVLLQISLSLSIPHRKKEINKKKNIMSLYTPQEFNF